MGSIPIGSIMNLKQIGIFGEKIAEKFLKNKGYKILDKNYSPKFISGPKKGEIDIVAKRDDIISFVEVKILRDSPGTVPQFSPEMKVDYLKQRKILKTAESWLMEKKIPIDSKWQIDVISIRINLENKKAKIRHFLNV